MDNIEKMLAGKIYDPSDPRLHEIARKTHRLCQQYNLLPDTDSERKKILKELLPNAKGKMYLQGGIYFDYGEFTYIGDNFYANQNLTVLDTCPVRIGDNCFFGSNITLATPLHPLLAKERNTYYDEKVNRIHDDEYGKPITIGNNVWMGCNVVVCPGVTIGDNCVIGAGSVVTRDIPANHLAFGVPAKPIREITEKDSIFLKKELF